MTPEAQRVAPALDSRAIPLKRWALCCYGQIAVALIMGALGMIDQHTVIPACYFGVVNIVVGVIASEKSPTSKTRDDQRRTHND